MTTATRELVDHVRKALVRADSETKETPDYDVLAETAVIATIEWQALRAVQRLKRDLEEGE